MEEFDKEVIIARKKLQELQNFERISFFNWLMHVNVYDVGGFRLLVPWKLVCFFAIYLFISRPLIGKVMESPDVITTASFTVFICYLIYFRFSRLVKSEKEHNLWEYAKRGVAKLLRKVFG